MTHAAPVAGPDIVVGKMIKRARERLDLSQSQFAESLGIDHSFISRIEAWHRSPSPNMASRFAEALRMTEVERNQLLLALAGLEDRSVLLDKECVELSRLLHDDSLTLESRLHLRETVRTIVAAWRAR